MQSILDAVPVVLGPTMILLVFLGTVIGVIMGAIPGISITLAISLLVPVTFAMDQAPALVFLGAVYAGGLLGASISAILINVPGTPAAVATMIDGYELTKQGKAGTALGATVMASLIGGQFGVLVLLFGAPLVAKWALEIGSQEFFWIVIFAMTSVGALGTDSLLKGLVAATLGLLLGTVGTHPFTGTMRFTFGSTALYEGIPIVIALVGLFSIPEVLRLAEGGARGDKRIESVGSLMPGMWAVFRHKMTVLRSSILGLFIGLLPGAGADIASIVGYNETRRASREPETFGKGSVDGVIGSETANNSVMGGSLIPMLTLGIPGNAVTAALIGGLLIHGLIPGPRLFQTNPEVVYPFILSLLLANIAFVIVSLVGLRYIARVVLIPPAILAPGIAAVTMLGAVTYRGNLTDIWIALALGIFGYVLVKAKYPLPPLVLGIILGPLAEKNLERSATIAAAHQESLFGYFLTSPISLVFIALSVLSIATTVYRELAQRRAKHTEPQPR